MHCYAFLSVESRAPLISLYVYSNIFIMVVDYYISLTYEHLVLDSEQSTC